MEPLNIVSLQEAKALNNELIEKFSSCLPERVRLILERGSLNADEPRQCSDIKKARLGTHFQVDNLASFGLPMNSQLR